MRSFWRRWSADPLAVEEIGVDADDEHLFVVGAVEDDDLAGTGQHAHRSPEKVMHPLDVGRRFEAADEDALRVDARHDVLDRAVFAGGVEGLEDDDDRVFAAGPQQVLRGGQAGDVFQQRHLGLVFVLEARRERGIEILETYLLTGWNEKMLVVQTVRGCHETGLRSVDVHGAERPGRDFSRSRYSSENTRRLPAVGE